MWSVIQGAVQGRGHLRENIPCQDKTCYTLADGALAAALADGAGSAKLSHFGAERITQYITKLLAERFDEIFANDDGASVRKELVEGIKAQINALAQELECDPRDLASTLLAVAVKDGRYIIVHIGDGVIGYTKAGMIKTASMPENGEFANTTVFTTSKEALSTMKLMKGNIGGIDGFVLMSDGAEAGLYKKSENRLADILGRIIHIMRYAPAENMEKQLNRSLLTVIRMATTDDCSLVLMSDRGDGAGYLSLDRAEKITILGVKPDSAGLRQLKHCDDILAALETPQSISCLSKRVHIKPKYLSKHLERLAGLGFIEVQGNMYHTIITM